MPGVTRDNLDEVFTYHPPTGDEQIKSYQRLREEGKRLAEAILEEVPVCGDQQAAIRKVREAVMTANAGIALMGSV